MAYSRIPSWDALRGGAVHGLAYPNGLDGRFKMALNARLTARPDEMAELRDIVLEGVANSARR